MAQATNELTPMRRQYQQIKDQHKDCILMFRLGDFYEMFDEDAKLTARELDLTLTTRDRGKPKEEQTPMCGVPYHSVDSYIARLVQKGYKVAICEQMEDPATAKGLVQRDITRIITPGTVTESCMLDENKNNYIGCIYGESGKFGLAFCDVSTGAFFTTVCSDAQNVASELGRFAPSEILRYGANVDCEVIDDAVFRRLNCCVSEGKQELFALESAEKLLENHFHATLSQMGIAGMPASVIASGALLQTLLTLQKNDLAHIRELQYYTTGRFMELDLDARRNLELTETMRSKEKRGTLLWVLDKTHTAMGGRMLRSWLEKPLLDPVEITRRHGAVEELTDNVIVRGELEEALRDVTDLERVQTRIVTGTVNCRDLLGLARGFRALPDVKAQLQKCDSPLLKKLEAAIDPLTDCADRIENTLVDDPPLTIREGGIIRKGASEEADRLRDIMEGGSGTIAAIEASEREKTGIRTLKVGFNRVFGYYIEVSKSFIDQVPANYIRKQTLANCERYITQELKELENQVLTAKDRLTALEYQIFTQLRECLAKQAARVQQTAAAVAHLTRALEGCKCSRRFAPEEIITKDWTRLTDADLAAIAACGCRQASCEKLHFDEHEAFSSLCFLEQHLTLQQLQAAADHLFADAACGHVLRVKGFAPDPQGTTGWLELNATAVGRTLEPIPQGQDVLIVIGEGLDKAAIEARLKA